ncbi:hypothetical protein [Streptomyces lydicus]|uniref:hypothetical protein n=1 Tax=Streptomyces lydicus TaxID=47763 RepID=UPI0036F141C7
MDIHVALDGFTETYESGNDAAGKAEIVRLWEAMEELNHGIKDYGEIDSVALADIQTELDRLRLYQAIADRRHRFEEKIAELATLATSFEIDRSPEAIVRARKHLARITEV